MFDRIRVGVSKQLLTLMSGEGGVKQLVSVTLHYSQFNGVIRMQAKTHEVNRLWYCGEKEIHAVLMQ